MNALMPQKATSEKKLATLLPFFSFLPSCNVAAKPLRFNSYIFCTRTQEPQAFISVTFATASENMAAATDDRSLGLGRNIFCTGNRFTGVSPIQQLIIPCELVSEAPLICIKLGKSLLILFNSLSILINSYA